MDVEEYSKELGSPVKILNSIDQLTSSNVPRVQTLAQNLEEFVKGMSTKYNFFQDVLTPFLLGVEQVFCFKFYFITVV